MVLSPQSMSFSASMMFLRACSLSSGATASSRSRKITSAAEAAALQFVVNRSEKTARLIDLSFTAADPEAYVDCGYLMVDAVLPSGARERTPIPVAEDMQFALYRQSSTTMAVDRQTVLHGRAAVFVDLAGGGTRVSVNIKYALVVKSTYQGYNMLKAPTGEPGPMSTAAGRLSGKAAGHLAVPLRQPSSLPLVAWLTRVGR